MTILFLCPSFYPKIGGVEKHTFEVAKIISKKHKIIVITEDSKNVHKKFNAIDIYRFYFGKNDWFKKFRIWKTLMSKRKLFEKADIIYCHDVFFWYFPLRFMFPQKKIYTTFHGYETFPPRFKSIFIRKLSERLSNGNICVGDYIKKWYGTSPSYVTYGGVNKIQSSRPKAYSPLAKRLKILFVGRIDKDTGVEVYSEALEKLKNYEFIVCGYGALRKKFEAYGKILGFVRNTEKYIKHAEIVFASSYLSILEAMVLKKPVFSVYENQLKRDYLKMSPFSKFINISDSAKNLVEAINLYRKKPKSFEGKIEKGYNWVKKQSWNNLADLYLNLYNP